MNTIDMKGKPCPMPVVEAKKVLAQSDSVQVLVDNETAVQNLTRLGQSLNGKVETAAGEGMWTVTITGVVPGAAQAASAAPAASAAAPASVGPTVLLTADHMGRGSEELGKILIKGYIYSLTQLDPLPKAVYMLNSGVKLAVEGANTLPDLHTLEKAGVTIRCCGTCLNYYELTEKLGVGQVTDMMGISTALAGAERLIVL